MLVVQHRVNNSQTLASIPIELGVEIDIRSDQKGLYLSHDPFAAGERLEDFLKDYRHNLLVLNVKEEGLETEVERHLDQNGITNYFFLDQSLPFLVKRGIKGLTRQAARISEYESFESLELIAKFCEWAWVDFFHEPMLDKDLLSMIRGQGLKICLVSPELHSLDRRSDAQILAEQLRRSGTSIDAVCTKFPEMWTA
jgi:hypothetical protein